VKAIVNRALSILFWAWSAVFLGVVGIMIYRIVTIERTEIGMMLSGGSVIVMILAALVWAIVAGALKGLITLTARN
jgi:hypothetical protein